MNENQLSAKQTVIMITTAVYIANYAKKLQEKIIMAEIEAF